MILSRTQAESVQSSELEPKNFKEVFQSRTHVPYAGLLVHRWGCRVSPPRVGADPFNMGRSQPRSELLSVSRIKNTNLISIKLGGRVRHDDPMMFSWPRWGTVPAVLQSSCCTAAGWTFRVEHHQCEQAGVLMKHHLACVGTGCPQVIIPFNQ